MTREELLKSPEYWKLEIQNPLFNIVEDYMKSNNLKKDQLAKKLKCSKNCVTNILNGDFDYKISKLIDILLIIGKVPIVRFENIEKIIEEDKKT